MITKLKDHISLWFSLIDRKRLLIGMIPYLFISYAADKIYWLYRCCQGDTMITKLVVLLSNIGLAFSSPWPSLYPEDMLAGVTGAAALWAVVLYRRSNSKNFRHGTEYGSARWGTHRDIAPFIDKEPDNNIILTKTEMLTMKTHMKNP